MLDQIKSTSKNSIVYGLGNVSVKLVGLILIPIYTDPSYLSLDDYGILGILESTSLLVAAFLGLALVQAHTRWYWDEAHLGRQKSINFSLLAFLTVISVLACFAFYPFAGRFSELLFQTDKYRYLLRLMFFSLFLYSSLIFNVKISISFSCSIVRI